MIASARKRLQQSWLKVSKFWQNKLTDWSWVKFFLLGMLVGTILLSLIAYGSYRVIYSGKVFPHVWVGEHKMSGLNEGEAYALLADLSGRFLEENPNISFAHQDQSWEFDLSQANVAYKADEAVDELMDYGRRGNLGEQLNEQWSLFRKGKTASLNVSFDEEILKVFIATMAAEVNVPPVPTVLEILDSEDPDTGSRLVVQVGEAGWLVNKEEALRKVKENLSVLDSKVVMLEVAEESEEISDEQLADWKKKAEGLLDKELRLVFNNEVDRIKASWVLEEEDLVGFLSPTEEFDEEKIEEYMAGVTETVERPAQDALFQFNADIGRVVAFKPAKDGLTVDRQKAIGDLKAAITALQDVEGVEPVALVTARVAPKVANEQVNRLGIKELLGRGESTFYGSIASRIHNIKLAASRLNGLLVAPGETFSYNAALGDVSTATGFQTAYIIQEGRTVLGDGGGVCQDSTTLFRTVLDAGLPVVERRAHAYRVGYYEQNEKAGFDATVFAPTTDFKFLNDTPTHILIQAFVTGSKLVIEFYGTNDGRVATISNYKMWDVSPPPPDLYQDDPTLPAGTVKQVDWKAWGAKTKFDYKVIRNGEALYEKTFYSSFKPWQSVFLRGTGGV